MSWYPLTTANCSASTRREPGCGASPAGIWSVGRHPLHVGSQLLLASRTGVIWRPDAATGKELAKVDAGYPLATGPVLCGQNSGWRSPNGTLYEVRQP